MEAKMAQCQMEYEGGMWLLNHFSKAAEERAKDLGLAYDPFLADAYSAEEESILQATITKSLFKLYAGLQDGLNRIESQMKVHEQSLEARVRISVWFAQKEEVYRLQNTTLMALFEIIQIPATLEMQRIFNKTNLNQADKHKKMLRCLPCIIRKALPYLLKKE